MKLKDFLLIYKNKDWKVNTFISYTKSDGTKVTKRDFEAIDDMEALNREINNITLDGDLLYTMPVVINLK